jgi:TPR repeat protein
MTIMAQKPNTLQHSQEAEAAHLKSLELAQASQGKRDMQQVLHYMRIAADGGHAGAQCNLGFLYAVGDGVEADSSLAIHWFSSAADLGDIQACYNLSQLYLGGHGVSADESLALQLLTKAANLGHPDALYNLGIYSYSGSPLVPQDFKAAFVFFENAASVGHSDALFSVGLCYSKGHGVELDPIQAVAYYKRAADKGHANALFNLGLYYYYGEGGLNRDIEMAESLFLRADELGHNRAGAAAESAKAERIQQERSNLVEAFADVAL